MDDAKKKVGRPTKYKPEYCEQLIEHMQQGFSFCSFAGRIRVNIDTLYEWGTVHPNFSEAKKIGLGASLYNYECTLQAALHGQIENFNNTVAVWIGKNVHGWTDKKDVTSGGESLSITYKDA